MRAVQIASTGGPEVLKVVDVPDPVPAAGQVLLEVRTAGVTFADTLMRAGSFPAPLELPAVLGREVVGTVAGHGDGVDEPPLGERVAALLTAGGYADRVAADSERTVLVPAGVTDTQALGVLGSGLTAQGIVAAGRVTRGDHVLITAAAGGIGSLAVQLATSRGGHVTGLASTPAKRELVLALGAHAAVDSTANWESDVRTATDSRGIDVMLDSTGGPALTSGLRLLAPHGRHVLYGAASGSLGAVEQGQLGQIMQGNLSLTGFTLDVSAVAAVRQRVGDLLSMVVDGVLQVPAADGYPLAQAAEAHRALTGRRTLGKVALTTA